MSIDLLCPWCGHNSLDLNDWQPVWSNVAFESMTGTGLRRISTGAFCKKCGGHCSISVLKSEFGLKFQVTAEEDV